jgi:hypothetical protein
MARGKQLKAQSRPLYNATKWSINLALLAALLGIVGSALDFLFWLLRA